MNRTVAFSVLVLASACVLYAGPLNPPAGPVTSTYKTLTEVEPRIAINATNTPGDANSMFKIAQPGSYYLTGNITGVAAMHGIEIAVTTGGPSVTIDLMGYELAGVAGSLDGISVTVSGTRNVAVRHGSVREWGGDGVDVDLSANNLLEDLRVEGNGGDGLSAGSGCTVTGCTASSNTGDGIAVGFSSTVTGCTAFGNTGDGIYARSSNTVTGCTAYFNEANGISVDDGSTVTGCTAYDNTGDGISALSGSTVTGCTAFSNTGDGISAFSGSTVTGCTASENTGDGIQVIAYCRVTDNTCDGNGSFAGDGAGIHATCCRNRIEGNNVTGNDRGIDVDQDSNLIIRNSAGGNTTANYDIAAGNTTGTIVSTEAAMNAAANANVNITF